MMNGNLRSRSTTTSPSDSSSNTATPTAGLPVGRRGASARQSHAASSRGPSSRDSRRRVPFEEPTSSGLAADRQAWEASRRNLQHTSAVAGYRSATIASATRHAQRTSSRYFSTNLSMNSTGISDIRRSSRMSFTPGPGPRLEALMREDSAVADTSSTLATRSDFAIPTLTSVASGYSPIDVGIGRSFGVRLEVVLDKGSPGEKVEMYGGPRTGSVPRSARDSFPYSRLGLQYGILSPGTCRHLHEQQGDRGRQRSTDQGAQDRLRRQV